MSKPMAAPLNLDLTLAIVNGGTSSVGAAGLKAPTNAAY